MTTNAYLPSTAAELVVLLNLIPHPEGGFFLETFRSGTVPMSSNGQTNVACNAKNLVVTVDGRRRNCLSSIYWLPTLKSPIQPLVCNESDHVHYYQGGLPMEYIHYDPATQVLATTIVGPDVVHGHVLQHPIRGGTWKCGRLMASYLEAIPAEYSLIAEAVGPAFDFHDFHFVTTEELEQAKPPASVLEMLRLYVKDALAIDEINLHYDSIAVQEAKRIERL
jgi:predicted cupin superfamily sugar epimerase